MGGLMSVTGEPASVGGQPQKVGVALTDIMTGLYASNGILAALAERERSGLGQHIDLSLFDVTAATLANQASNYLVGGITPVRLGNAHPNIVPYQSFAVADGHIVIAVGNDSQFESLSTVLGLEEIATDNRFISNALRVKNRDELIDIIQSTLLQSSGEYWLNQCEVHSVPAGPINTIDQVLNDPQIKAREMRVRLDHADSDQLELVGNPIKFSRTPIEYKSAPPTLGEHTESVLERLKL
jgi:crotonobetainyl-CoA:carnitine CoA-transferase CaiB-like acyl-CoA transferase